MKKLNKKKYYYVYAERKTVWMMSTVCSSFNFVFLVLLPSPSAISTAEQRVITSNFADSNISSVVCRGVAI